MILMGHTFTAKGILHDDSNGTYVYLISSVRSIYDITFSW